MSAYRQSLFTLAEDTRDDGILAIQQGNRARAALRLSDLNRMHFRAAGEGDVCLADVMFECWDALHAALAVEA